MITEWRSMRVGDRVGQDQGRALTNHFICRTAGGRPHRQMESGMYFYKIEGTEAEDEVNAGKRLRDGVPLNGPGENSLEKLGWFRWERGQGWMVRKGLEKMTQAQVQKDDRVMGYRSRPTDLVRPLLTCCPPLCLSTSVSRTAKPNAIGPPSTPNNLFCGATQPMELMPTPMPGQWNRAKRANQRRRWPTSTWAPWWSMSRGWQRSVWASGRWCWNTRKARHWR